MDNDDIFNRIFDKLDTFEERLDTTCTNVTEIKTTLNDFIVSVNKKEIEMKDNIERINEDVNFTLILFVTLTFDFMFALISFLAYTLDDILIFNAIGIACLCIFLWPPNTITGTSVSLNSAK